MDIERAEREKSSHGVVTPWGAAPALNSGGKDRQHSLQKCNHRPCPAAGFFDGQNLRFRNFHFGTSFGFYQQGLVAILQKCSSDAQFDSPETELHHYRSRDPRLTCAAHRLPPLCLFSTGQASTLAKTINTVRNNSYYAYARRADTPAAEAFPIKPGDYSSKWPYSVKRFSPFPSSLTVRWPSKPPGFTPSIRKSLMTT